MVSNLTAPYMGVCGHALTCGRTETLQCVHVWCGRIVRLMNDGCYCKSERRNGGMIDGLVGWPWLHSDLGVGGLETARGARTPNEKKAYVQLNEFFVSCVGRSFVHHVSQNMLLTRQRRLNRTDYANGFGNGVCLRTGFIRARRYTKGLPRRRLFRNSFAHKCTY